MLIFTSIKCARLGPRRVPVRASSRVSAEEAVDDHGDQSRFGHALDLDRELEVHVLYSGLDRDHILDRAAETNLAADQHRARVADLVAAVVDRDHTLLEGDELVDQQVGQQ